MLLERVIENKLSMYDIYQRDRESLIGYIPEAKKGIVVGIKPFSQRPEMNSSADIDLMLHQCESYMIEHDVMNLVKQCLHKLCLHQPDNPIHFLAQHFSDEQVRRARPRHETAPITPTLDPIGARRDDSSISQHGEETSWSRVLEIIFSHQRYNAVRSRNCPEGLRHHVCTVRSDQEEHSLQVGPSY